MLVMDNASFHRTERIEQMSAEAGVKLSYSAPYSLDLNPIEEFFAELKAFIRNQWHEYEDNPRQGFKLFLEWGVSMVGGRRRTQELFQAC